LTDCITTIYFAKKIKNYIEETTAVESTFEELAKAEENE
jgi:hypothetical protein